MNLIYADLRGAGSASCPTIAANRTRSRGREKRNVETRTGQHAGGQTPPSKIYRQRSQSYRRVFSTAHGNVTINREDISSGERKERGLLDEHWIPVSFICLMTARVDCPEITLSERLENIPGLGA